METHRQYIMHHQFSSEFFCFDPFNALNIFSMYLHMNASSETKLNSKIIPFKIVLFSFKEQFYEFITVFQPFYSPLMKFSINNHYLSIVRLNRTTAEHNGHNNIKKSMHSKSISCQYRFSQRYSMQ